MRVGGVSFAQNRVNYDITSKSLNTYTKRYIYHVHRGWLLHFSFAFDLYIDRTKYLHSQYLQSLV